MGHWKRLTKPVVVRSQCVGIWYGRMRKVYYECFRKIQIIFVYYMYQCHFNDVVGKITYQINGLEFMMPNWMIKFQ